MGPPLLDDQASRTSARHSSGPTRSCSAGGIRDLRRRYYRRKLATGKTRIEAMRCLKRRISDAIYRQLVADARQATLSNARESSEADPGGHCGATCDRPARPCRWGRSSRRRGRRRARHRASAAGSLGGWWRLSATRNSARDETWHDRVVASPVELLLRVQEAEAHLVELAGVLWEVSLDEADYVVDPRLHEKSRGQVWPFRQDLEGGEDAPAGAACERQPERGVPVSGGS